MKRLVVVSDFHCGHDVGLTPPDFNPIFKKNSPKRFERYQKRVEYWTWFEKKIESLRPIDFLLINGDAVDGKGRRSGGTELITADRTEQVDMAAAIIKFIDAKKVVMAYGTGYHVGQDEDWEDAIARSVGAERISGQNTLDINGLKINYKHHIGASSIPHGRLTALAKDVLWNGLWAEHGEFPKANIVLRSHVHYFVFCGGYGWLGMITPALQGIGTKFGSRRVSGTVDFGFVHFDIEDNENFAWEPHILKLRRARREVITL